MLTGALMLLLNIAVPEAETRPSVPLRARWDAPGECPDTEGLRVQIEDVVGYPLRFADEAAVEVVGTAERVDGRYRVELLVVVQGEEERRTMTAEACDDAVQAAALVIGLALEPFVARQEETSVSLPEPPAPAPTPQVEEPAPQPFVETEPEPEPTVARSHQHRAALFAGAGGVFSMTSPAVASVHAGAAWLVDRIRVELSGHHRFATTVGGRQGARASSSGAALRGCWMPRLQSFEIGPCGGVEADAMVAVGDGPGVSGRRRTVPFVSLLVGADAVWVASPRVAIRVSGAVGLVPYRPRLHLSSAEGSVEIFIATPVNARAALAFEFRLPK